MKKTNIIIILIILPCLLEAAPNPDLWAYWQAHSQDSIEQIDHSSWGRFLNKYIDVSHPSGIYRVRYSDVTARDQDELQGYLERLQEQNVSRLNRIEQKAFWINLYNALTVKIVLEHYPVRSIRDIDISPGWFSNGPWDAKLITIEGLQISLNDIEHRILRPIWQDNRVHYALNCASLGCPNLQNQPFTMANMEHLLDKGARDYINHPRGAKPQNNQFTVSSIYKWFRVDFGGNETKVIEHLLHYAGPELDNFLKNGASIDKYDYDWQLNE